MKKIIIGIAGLLLFASTGCTKTEKISCTKDTAVQDGMKMTQTMKATFKDNIVTYLEIGTTLEVEEQLQEYFDAANTSLVEEYAIYQDKTGIEVVNDKKELKSYVGVKINLNKVSEEDKKELNLNYGKQSKESTKAEFEAEGYTCK